MGRGDEGTGGRTDVGTTVARFGAAILKLAPDFADNAHERIGVLFLDRDWRMIGSVFFGDGSDAAVEVPVRGLFSHALQADACALVVAHNHPSGSAEPRPADIVATRRLAMLARGLGIDLLDHLIFAGDRITSLRERGLI